MSSHVPARQRLASLFRRESNSLWILAEKFTGTLLNFIAVIAIMRVLGPAPYGQWAFAFSVVSILLVTGHLGLEGLLLRMLVEQPERGRHLLGVATGLKFAIYIPVICGVGAFFSLQTGTELEERLLLYVLMIAVLAQPLTTSFVAWLNSNLQFTPAARARITAVTVGFVAKIALIFGGIGIVWVGLAHSAMLLLEALLLFLTMRQRGGPAPWQWRFDWAIARAMLSQSLYLFFATVFAILYFNAGVMVLSAYSSSYQVGLYALAPQVIMAAQMLPYAVTLSRVPGLTRSSIKASERDEFYRAIKQMLMKLLTLSGAVMFALGLFILVAFDFVFGSAYVATKPILGLTSFALPALFVRQLTTQLFMLTDDGQWLAAIELTGLVVVLAILLLAVPQYGAQAAAIALISGCWLTVFMSLVLFDRGRFLIWLWKKSDK